ncbi:MAG: efflux RND transporter periplasmic adaptor subunit [Elusimicrobiaceae bacterium]|nr:efflux RND transporter periplasmic adaptor subunit [Elusimicrobiaceae bacterium]
MKKNISLALTGAVLALCGCGDKTDGPQQPAEQPAGQAASFYAPVTISADAQAAANITAVKARKAGAAETFQAMGHAMQDAQATHHVSAAAAGRLESFAVTLGQRVAPGDTLAELRDSSGAKIRLISGYTGIVSAFHTGPGAQVDGNTFICTITEIDPLWGVLDIHEINLSKLRAGQKVTVRTAAYPGRTFAGTIVFVSPEIDPESRTVKARVSMENPAGLMKFGMFIDAEVETGRYSDGILLPSSAVQNGPDGPFVFVKKPGGEFIPRPVQAGATRDGKTEITGGLKPGEEVVAEGAYLLKSEMLKNQIEGD